MPSLGAIAALTTVSFDVSGVHGNTFPIDSTILFSNTKLLLEAKVTRIPLGDFDRTPLPLMVSPENAMWLEELTERDDNTGVCPEAALIVRNFEYLLFEMLTAP